MDSERHAFDPRVEIGADDLVFTKRMPSAFFESPLQSYLVWTKVDTVIVTGGSTSGCVRATAVESLSRGYRTIVPEECVADKHESYHYANLTDLQLKYADVGGRGGSGGVAGRPTRSGDDAMMRLPAALLAFLALAGAAAAAPVPEAQRAPLDLRRTTLVVKDLDASLRFYRDALGAAAGLRQRDPHAARGEDRGGGRACAAPRAAARQRRLTSACWA